jgi:hypothetical protein
MRDSLTMDVVKKYDSCLKLLYTTYPAVAISMTKHALPEGLQR